MENVSGSSLLGSSWERREGIGESQEPTGRVQILDQPQGLVRHPSASQERRRIAGQLLSTRQLNTPSTIDDVSNLINDALAHNELYKSNQHQVNYKYGKCEFVLRGMAVLALAFGAACNALGLLQSPVGGDQIVLFCAVLLSIGFMYGFAFGGKAMEIKHDISEAGGCLPYLKSKANAKTAGAGIAGTLYGVGSGVLDSDNAEGGILTVAGKTKETAGKGIAAVAKTAKYVNWGLEIAYPALAFLSLAKRYKNNGVGLIYGDTQLKRERDENALKVLKRYKEIVGQIDSDDNALFFNKGIVASIVTHMSNGLEEYNDIMADLESLRFDKPRTKRLLELWNRREVIEVSDTEAKGYWDRACDFIGARKEPAFNLLLDTACIYVTAIGLGVPFASPLASAHYFGDFEARGLLLVNSTLPYGLNCTMLQTVPMNHLSGTEYFFQVFSYMLQGGGFSPIIKGMLVTGSFYLKTGAKDCDFVHCGRSLKYTLRRRLGTPAGAVATGASVFGVVGYHKIAEGVEKSVLKFAGLLNCNLGIPYPGWLLPPPSSFVANLGRGFLDIIVFNATYDAVETAGNSVIRNFNQKADVRRILYIRNTNHIGKPTYGSRSLALQEFDAERCLLRMPVEDIQLIQRSPGSYSIVGNIGEQRPVRATLSSHPLATDHHEPSSLQIVEVHQEEIVGASATVPADGETTPTPEEEDAARAVQEMQAAFDQLIGQIDQMSTSETIGFDLQAGSSAGVVSGQVDESLSVASSDGSSETVIASEAVIASEDWGSRLGSSRESDV
ncbi:hypothetical protein GCM10023116_39800 [Kistimonas scapharcae]|uniref:Uncharacterized protein n=1 Tax=Kistimonas scapharcae TaxID=1036133 RepID=A0ABP8V8L7_9GAMM